MQDELLNVLRLVQFTYVSDQEQYGVDEKWVDTKEWAGGSFKGDCEDFALVCRYLVGQLGYRSRLVYCKTEKGEGHLVLEVEGWILDNRSVWVKPQQDVLYTWLKMSGYELGDEWHYITGE